MAVLLEGAKKKPPFKIERGFLKLTADLTNIITSLQYRQWPGWLYCGCHLEKHHQEQTNLSDTESNIFGISYSQINISIHYLNHILLSCVTGPKFVHSHHSAHINQRIIGIITACGPQTTPCTEAVTSSKGLAEALRK